MGDGRWEMAGEGWERVNNEGPKGAKRKGAEDDLCSFGFMPWT
jgi:hypothetical protein